MNLINYIKLYPHTTYDYDYISSLIDVSDKEIYNSLNCWTSKGLSKNPNLTPEIIDSKSDLDWDMISLNIKLNLPIFKRYIDKWNIRLLSYNGNLTFNIVTKYMDKKWDWFPISKKINNPSLLHRYSSKIIMYAVDYSLVDFSNDRLTDLFLSKYDRTAILSYALRYVNWNIAMKYIHLAKDTYHVSQNINISSDWLENEKCSFQGLSRNRSISFEQVEKYIDKDWDFEFLCIR